MTAAVVAHLNFTGRARAALEYYAAAFGGRAVVRTYGDFGMPAGLPDAERVVHGQVVGAEGFSVMAYDVPSSEADLQAGATRRENGTTITDRPFFLALQAETLEEAIGHWDALAEGASIVEPLAASAWSAGFGMLTDRFGVVWAISVVEQQG
ncbi:VOC family protein [Rathayibacter sp. VKM Ac-2835]|uniref:VOC family protein n=1 Tax=Rathayibacter sp. VKM Ac-2835 TaxID=2739043 RepID=UPI001566B7DB|nr:VOC family protein [Rathayibacter sp. VKM Ac-2835]NRG40356.1 VOC family protein [Rathayibacter sp. VKM Ac-2835]